MNEYRWKKFKHYLIERRKRAQSDFAQEMYSRILEKMNEMEEDYAEAYKKRFEKIEFDYNFDNCPFCNCNIPYEDDNEGTCPSGCVTFDVDLQGETVFIELFGSGLEGEKFLIGLCHEAYPNKKPTIVTYLEEYVKAVQYWKTNDRYLTRIKQK